MLRYSVEPGPARANISRRLRALRRRADPGQLPRDPARREPHPPGRVHARRAARMSGAACSSRSASAWPGCSRSRATLYGNELPGKRLDARLRELREAARRELRRRSTSRPRTSSCSSPCSPTSRSSRCKLRSELDARRARATLAERAAPRAEATMVELLFWPALVGYGEAAVALVGEARRPGLAGRLAIWGVRLGWLAQTALLAAQAARADGSRGRAGPARSTCSRGSSSARLPDLGLPAALPAARPRGDAASRRCCSRGVRRRRDRRGGRPTPASSSRCTSALMLAAFAGFTLAAGLAALYLWQERRLKRREARILRRARPAARDARAARRRARLASRSPSLTLGIASGSSASPSTAAASTR